MIKVVRYVWGSVYVIHVPPCIKISLFNNLVTCFYASLKHLYGIELFWKLCKGGTLRRHHKLFKTKIRTCFAYFVTLKYSLYIFSTEDHRNKECLLQKILLWNRICCYRETWKDPSKPSVVDTFEHFFSIINHTFFVFVRIALARRF